LAIEKPPVFRGLRFLACFLLLDLNLAVVALFGTL
jgi:hypothetical protein